MDYFKFLKLPCTKRKRLLNLCEEHQIAEAEELDKLKHTT